LVIGEGRNPTVEIRKQQGRFREYHNASSNLVSFGVEKNLFGGRGLSLIASLLLLTASAVSASPTFTSENPACVSSFSTDRAAGVANGSHITLNQLKEIADAFLQAEQDDNRTTTAHITLDQLSEMANAFLQVEHADNRMAKAQDNRCLPAIPSGVALVLSGFFCVTLVRDRRSWLAVLAGVLWVGQIGFNSLPQISSRLCRKVHNTQPIEPAPDSLYFINDGFNSDHNIYAISNVIQKDTQNLEQTSVFVPLFSGLANDCPVSGTRQFVCFQPALIFCMIPRGPPVFT